MADNPYAKYANPYAGYVPVGVPDPMKPLDLAAKQAGLTRTQQEIRQAEATAASDAEKARAEALSAQIKAKQDQEAYDAAHPKGSTATVLGPDSLKSLSLPDQELVKALAEGRLAFPGGFALKAPWWQQKLEQVAAYDPSFDATNFNNRAKARAALVTGKLGNSANALNTAIGHIGLLSTQLGGTASHGPWSIGGIPIPGATTVNAIENAALKSSGQSGITNYVDTATKLADELESAYRNGGGAEQGVVRQLRNLDPNMSAEQKRGIVANALELLASKQAANLYQYNIGSGGKPPVDLLDPAARNVLNQFPDIRDKYFSPPPAPLSHDAAALLSANGGTPPPGAPPAPDANGGPPSIGPGGADYSGMVGPNQQSLATGQYRNVFDPIGAAALSGFIRKGVPYDTAAAYATSHGFQPPNPSDYAAAVQFAKTHGGATNVEASRSIPTTIGERLAASPAAAAISGAVSGGTAGLSDVIGRSLLGPDYDANRAALAVTNPGADLAGNVLGGVGGMFGGGRMAANILAAGGKGGAARNLLAWAARNPVKASALGDAAYATTYGASENPDNPLAGAATGLVTAPIASLAGQGAAKAVGSTMRGVVNPAVQRLKDAGIPLTVGEVLGGGFKKAQDAMTSVFGPGSMVARRYAEGRNALNEAAFNQAGQIVGAPINAVGQKGIQALDAAKNNAYANALNPVSINLNTPQVVGDIRNALNTASGIPNVDQASDIATGGLTNYIGNAAPNGVMAGPDFQQAYRGLSRLGRQSSNRIYGHEIGQALGQGQDALVSALESQNPGAYEAFLRANSANRHLSVLSDAVNAAKNQLGDNGEPLFTPAQLGTAATSNARTYSGKVAAASGQRPFNQLANDAQQVMSSKLPESGTFPRQLMGLAMTGGLATSGGMFGGHENGLEGATEGAVAPLAALSLLGTRRGQQLLTSALLNRPQRFIRIGNYIVRNPEFGGDLATTGALQLSQ